MSNIFSLTFTICVVINQISGISCNMWSICFLLDPPLVHAKDRRAFHFKTLNLILVTRCLTLRLCDLRSAFPFRLSKSSSVISDLQNRQYRFEEQKVNLSIGFTTLSHTLLLFCCSALFDSLLSFTKKWMLFTTKVEKRILLSS